MAAESPYVLRYSLDGSEWEQVPLNPGEYLIGRQSDCDIHLNNPEVSRYHTNLKVELTSLWLTDLGSTNGTFVEDMQLPPNRKTEVPSGAEIFIGPYSVFIESTDLVPDTEADVPIEPHAETIVRVPIARPAMYDVAALREAEFSPIAQRAYLNNASTAPLPKRVRDKVVWSLDELHTHPSQHMGSGAWEMYARWRSAVAKFVNAASPSEVVVVPNVSVGLNALAQSLGLRPGENILLCDVEFPANVYPWMSRERDGAVMRLIPSSEGGLTLDGVQRAADDRTRVVAASSVQFFTGHRTDLSSIGAFCRERGILFVVDAIQSIGHEVIDVQAMNIDVLVASGYKSLLSPPGVGFMVVRDAVSDAILPRLISALSTRDIRHELRYDPSPGEGAMRFFIGTPDVAGMHGMLESITLIDELTRESIDYHTSGLTSYAIERARSMGYEPITPLGQHGPIMTFRSEHSIDEANALVASLEADHNVVIATYPDRHDVAHLRLSVHCYNTRDDIDCLFDALKSDG